MIRIAVDAMGGDFAPESNVLGAASALRGKKDSELSLVGREEQVKAILSGQDYDESRLRIVHTEEVIGKFTGADAAAHCPRIGRSSALAALKKLTEEGVIIRQGSGRGTFYVRADSK